MSWITKLDKGDFVDCEIMKEQKANGVSRKLVGFTLDDRRVPRHGYTIEDKNGVEIGVVTSGTQSPSLGYPIGMGYVETSFAKSGTEIVIDINGKKLNATVSKLPFYKEI